MRHKHIIIIIIILHSLSCRRLFGGGDVVLISALVFRIYLNNSRRSDNIMCAAQRVKALQHNTHTAFCFTKGFRVRFVYFIIDTICIYIHLAVRRRRRRRR